MRWTFRSALTLRPRKNRTPLVLSQGLDFSVSVEEPPKPNPQSHPARKQPAGGGLTNGDSGLGRPDPYAVMSVKYTELAEQANQMAAKLRMLRRTSTSWRRRRALQRDKPP